MKKYYFSIISSLLLIFSVVAFSDILFTDIYQKSNSDPKFIIHGLMMLAWFVTFVAQTYFILIKKVKTHKRIGKIGFLLSIGVFLSTLYIFIAVYKGWNNMEPFVRANRLFMLSFAFFILLAYINKNNPAKHKRYIFWAIVLPIEPIMGRVSDVFLIDQWELFYFLVWHTLFASFFVFDWISIKKIHFISWIGLAWFYISWIISFYS